MKCLLFLQLNVTNHASIVSTVYINLIGKIERKFMWNVLMFFLKFFPAQSDEREAGRV